MTILQKNSIIMQKTFAFFKIYIIFLQNITKYKTHRSCAETEIFYG